jgi:4'-phosphopantetheinyl transferase
MTQLNAILPNLPDRLILKNEEIHVWCTNLDLPLSEINLLANCLSNDEIIRANRFKFAHLQHRFLVCRAILRILLAKYLDLQPSALIFNYSDRGKPSLAVSCNPLAIEFNVSHSENLALYGFVINYSLGIDLERIRTIADLDSLAKRFFHPQEYQLLRKLANKEKQELFFKIWTAKEAYLKATGQGISGGLDSIEIDDFQVKINNIYLDNWYLYNLPLNSDFWGSLAINCFSKIPEAMLKFDWLYFL